MKNELWVYKAQKGNIGLVFVVSYSGEIAGAHRFVGNSIVSNNKGKLGFSTNSNMLVSGLVHKVAPSILGGWTDE